LKTKRQKERQERAERRASQLSREASAAFDKARKSVAHIPPGQPVLVGHYSERRHRRDLERHDQAMRKGVELAKQANRIDPERAGTAVLSNDPEALVALRTKLTELEADREAQKTCNRAYKKNPEVALAALSDELRAYAERSIRFGESHPFSSYHMKNLGAQIRSVKARIAELERKRSAEPRTIEGDGFSIEEDPDDDRIRLSFDARLSREDYQRVRSLGFRWSRQHEAFSRHLNHAGHYAVRQAVKLILNIEVSL